MHDGQSINGGKLGILLEKTKKSPLNNQRL